MCDFEKVILGTILCAILFSAGYVYIPLAAVQDHGAVATPSNAIKNEDSMDYGLELSWTNECFDYIPLWNPEEHCYDSWSFTDNSVTIRNTSDEGTWFQITMMFLPDTDFDITADFTFGQGEALELDRGDNWTLFSLPGSSEEEIRVSLSLNGEPKMAESGTQIKVGCIQIEITSVDDEELLAEPIDPELIEPEPRPVETEPVETEPVETKPVETKPVETEPVETEPAETKPVETKPVETEPAETEPAETKPVETAPAETKPAETEPAETEPAETEPAETGPSEETAEAAEQESKPGGSESTEKTDTPEDRKTEDKTNPSEEGLSH